MSQPSSAQIVVTRPEHTIPKVSQRVSRLASSPILDVLLPTLGGLKAHGYKASCILNKVDDYMRQETTEFFLRLATFLEPWRAGQDFTIKLYWQTSTFSVLGQDKVQVSVSDELNQNKWMREVMQWLQPNLIGLAESQELLAFSKCYEKDQQQAMSHYTHLTDSSSVMQSVISVSQQGEGLKVQWDIESPVTVFSVYQSDG